VQLVDLKVVWKGISKTVGLVHWWVAKWVALKVVTMVVKMALVMVGPLVSQTAVSKVDYWDELLEF
jgi:hypothetical protein